MTDTLPQFENRDVVRTSIAVTNAGDGLSEAVGIEPQVFHLGDVVHVVLECEVTRVNHRPIRDTEVLERVHTLKAGTATIVEPDAVADMLREQKEKNEAARRLADGTSQLPVDEHNLRGDHALGLHADSEQGLQENCPLCQDEKDAEASEGDQS